ncbi:hypothetical protein LPJ66_004293, partial [Kickxella alabastrina]
MSRNPFDDHSSSDPFADDPFGDSGTASAFHSAGAGRQLMADDDEDAVPLHSVQDSDTRGGLFSTGGGGRHGAYSPIGAGADTLGGYSERSAYSDA